MKNGDRPCADALTLPGCDPAEVSQAREAAAQLLDRFRRGRSQDAIEPIADLVSPAEGADQDG